MAAHDLSRRDLLLGSASAASDPVLANKKTYWESNGQVTRRIRVT